METLNTKTGPVITQVASNPTAPAIATTDLTKNYGRNRGIIEVNLEVKPGEIFGFLGPNGAGKTTTIRLLLDLITPTSGHAKIFGHDCHKDSVEIKKLIGYLPGEFSLFPSMTGAETLRYFAGLREGIKWEVITTLAKRLDLDLNKKFREYSRGNKQKVGLIQAVMHHPRLLIVDEPTSGLDPLMQQEFFHMLREEREQGTTIFLSSHILSEVEKTCDRVALIREGRIIRVGDVADFAKMKSHYLEMEFRQDVPLEEFERLPGVTQLRKEKVEDEYRFSCMVLPEALDGVVKVAARYPLAHFISREPSLEEVFLEYYRGGEVV